MLKQEKWAPLLDYDGLDAIKDPHRRMVTARSLGEPRTGNQRRKRVSL